MRSRRRRFYLIANLGDTDIANAVEQRDYIAMKSFFISANRNLHGRISLLKLEKRGLHLVVGNVLPVDVGSITGKDLDGHHGRVELRGWGDRRWQIYTNPFHVRLAQANHHKTGEEKEHDINQRNDLDARSFVRDW